MTATLTKISIRSARRSDFPQIREWDEFWGDRRQEIQRGEIFVAESDQNECLGYMRLARNEFLNYPLVAALCTKPSIRRTGVAIALVRHLEIVMVGLRVFTTTEVTNEEMIALLKKAGFQESGFIDMLNSDGTRELIFSRQF